MQKKEINTTDDYIEVSDKHGFTSKVVNFDNPKMCPRKGVIDIQAIRVTNRHENRKSFSLTRDNQTGIIYGIPIGIDPKTGELRFQRIILYNSLQLNLSNPKDAKLWTVIRYSEFLEGSPNARGKAEYKVFDRELEAEKVIVENKVKRKAGRLIDDMRPLEMYDMARNCGLSVENDSPATVQSLLYKKSENNPEEFMRIYDDINRPILTVFKRGIVTGLVKFDLNKGYIWKDSLPLGSNDMQVIKYLHQNVSLLVTMDQETKERDRIFKDNASEEDYKKTILEALSNDNSSPVQTFTSKEFDKENAVREERLAKKEADLDARLEKMNAMMEQILKQQSNVPPVEEKKEISVDTDLAELRKKAKQLGMKGAHLYTDKVKLSDYITEQELLLS